MLNKPIRRRDLVSRREYHRRGVAIHRAKKAKSLTDMQESINYHREKLGLPPKDFTEPKYSNKGRRRKNYLPPKEERAIMTNEQLSSWKKEERRKRKIQRAHDKKVLEDMKFQELKDELAHLEKLVKQLDDGVKEFVETVAVEGLEEMEGILDDEYVTKKAFKLEVVNSAPKIDVFQSGLIEAVNVEYVKSQTKMDTSNSEDVELDVNLDTKVSKPESINTKSEFNMEIDKAQYVESRIKIDISKPEDVKLVDNLDTKHAPKNKHVITEPDASDATLTTIGMFKLDLEAPSLEEFDLIQFDPTSDDLYVDANRVGMLDDSSITVDHGFSTNDKLLVADSMPDFVDSVGLLGDENLLSGNALVRVFDD